MESQITGRRDEENEYLGVTGTAVLLPKHIWDAMTSANVRLPGVSARRLICVENETV